MNTLTKRIAGMVAAGLLTVSGVAMVAQPAYAADKNPNITVSKAKKNCKAEHGTSAVEDGTYACALPDGRSLECPVYKLPGQPTRVIASNCTLGLTKPSQTTTSAATGRTSPGGSLTPTTTVPPRPGTGVLVSPGGALGG